MTDHPSFQRQRLALIAASAAVAVLASGCVVAPARHYPGPPTSFSAMPPAPPAQSAPMYFYPERGQPEAAQERDRYECYRWAVRETGTDPGMTPVRQPYAAVQPTGPGPLRDGSGAVGGAATGAVVGAAMSSPRHAGQNAIFGAVFGAMLGAAAQESRAQAIENVQARQAAAIQAAQAAQQVPTDNFRRAVSACMQGRGYRIG